MALVCIHETLDIQEALVVKAALDAYGIFASTHGLDLAYLTGGGIPPVSMIRILVSEEESDAARTLVETRDGG
jgi:hypothetical protein